MNPRVPHLHIVVAASSAVIIAYAAFSVWVVGFSGDVALIGDTIGTWKSFAVAAVAFWLGSSSGGKASPEAPLPVKVDQPANDPIPVETKP